MRYQWLLYKSNIENYILYKVGNRLLYSLMAYSDLKTIKYVPVEEL